MGANLIIIAEQSQKPFLVKLVFHEQLHKSGLECLMKCLYYIKLESPIAVEDRKGLNCYIKVERNSCHI